MRFVPGADNSGVIHSLLNVGGGADSHVTGAQQKALHISQPSIRVDNHDGTANACSA